MRISRIGYGVKNTRLNNFIGFVFIIVLVFCKLNSEAGMVAIPEGMVAIPKGMVAVKGKNYNGFHCVVNNTPLFMDSTEITGKKWNEVFSWGQTNGYSFSTDVFNGVGSKGKKFPVHGVTFFDALIWCNVRSEMEGFSTCYFSADGKPYKKSSQNVARCSYASDGYRLPTINEWEYAAWGGRQFGGRFGMYNKMSHEYANYCSKTNIYDTSGAYHPSYCVGDKPYTSPVASFKPNEYGLFDMLGNVAEWCWKGDTEDLYLGLHGVLKGGSWRDSEIYLTVVYSLFYEAAGRHVWLPQFTGFRCVRKSEPN